MTTEGSGGVPIKLLSSDGSIDIQGGGAVDLKVAGGGQVSSGSLTRNPGPANTTSAAPVLLQSIPFTLASAGQVLARITASTVATPQVAAEVFNGAIFTADIDGTPLLGSAFYELDAGPFPAVVVNTLAGCTTLESLSQVLAAGAHTLNVFWQTTAVLNGEVRIDIFTGDLSVHIGRN